MLTTSFGHSIRRNQHCINLRSHLGSAASFVLNQLQKYNIRDRFPETFNRRLKISYSWTSQNCWYQQTGPAQFGQNHPPSSFSPNQAIIATFITLNKISSTSYCHKFFLDRILFSKIKTR